MKVEILEKSDRETWKQLQQLSNLSFHFKLELIHVIENTYSNCKSLYYLIKDKDQIKALFPFFIVKSKLFSTRVISLPFFDVGYFWGNYDLLPQVIEMIRNFKEYDISSIEIRTNTFVSNFNTLKQILEKIGFIPVPSKQQFILRLTSEEDLWKRFHKHTRNDIRKALKSGLKIVKIDNKQEVKKFYKLYFSEMRRFGTPQHSFKFFENMFTLMNNYVLGLNCYYNDIMIASLIMLYGGDYGYIMFNVSNPSYRKFRPNDLLYWEAIKYGLNNNLKFIDLGQVDANSEPGTHAYGIYKFKSKWLGDLYDRIYFYYSFEGQPSLAGEKKEKYKKFRAMWRKLPPLIIKKLGPWLCAQLAI